MTWLLLLLFPAYEAGVWTTALGLRGRKQRKAREYLIHGTAGRTELPFIDSQLRKAAGASTKSQARVVRSTVAATRWFTNSKAFEHAVLLGVKARWPKKGQLETKVSFCL